MIHIRHPITAISILALLASACTDDATDPSAQVFRDTFSGGCTNCNNNSPNVNLAHVPELNLDGLENDAHLRLMGILDPADLVHDIDFVGDDMHAVDDDGAPVASGDGLEGWKLWLRDEDDDDVYILVLDHATVLSPYTNTSLSVSVFALAYEDPLDPGASLLKSVCPGAEPEELAVTFIAGEIYDREAIDLAGAPRWFSLACQGGAAYKMKMLGYSPSLPLGLGPQTSTPAQRRATLKMITADYCGDGTPYTEPGVEVHWENVGGSVGGAAVSDPIEAIWSEDGALCLSNRRLPDPENPVHCELPSCEGAPPVSGFEWTTRVSQDP